MAQDIIARGMAASSLQPEDVVNNSSSTITDKPLSANMGKELQDQITNISTIGRFLSIWSCVTGTPSTEPTTTPYLYKTGDYFIVGEINSTGTNLKPNGPQYPGPTPAPEIEQVSISDVYYYDGSTWKLQKNSQRPIVVDSDLSTTSTNPVQNKVITEHLNNKPNITNISQNDYGVYYDTTSNKLRLVETPSAIIPTRSASYMPVTLSAFDPLMKTNFYTGTTDPTTSTEARFVGLFYINTTNNKIFQCVAKTAQGTEPETYTCTWVEIISASNIASKVREVTPDVQTTIQNPVTTNTVYDLGETATLTINLPTSSVGNFVKVDFLSGSTATTLTISSANVLGESLTPEANKYYSLYFDYGRISNDGNSYGWRMSYAEWDRPAAGE